MDKEAAKVTLETLFGRIDSLIAKDGKASKAELSKVFGDHADQFLEFCTGILNDAADMSQEDFDTNWANRMDGVVKTAEDTKAAEEAAAAPAAEEAAPAAG